MFLNIHSFSNYLYITLLLLKSKDDFLYLHYFLPFNVCEKYYKYTLPYTFIPYHRLNN